MKPSSFSTALGIALLVAPVLVTAAEPPNPKIDQSGFVALVQETATIRQESRVSEERFLAMAAEPGTIILDARSKDKYENIHIKGAVHLAFTDFTEEELAKVIPAKTTRILIYCNNNFVGEQANFPSKMVKVALNSQTFVNLHAYGYTNVFELGPLLNIRTTKIPFEGKSVNK